MFDQAFRNIDDVLRREAGCTQDYGAKQQVFIDFVLDQYVNVGVEELDTEKLPTLLRLKYDDLADATAELGDVSSIRQAFIGFQRKLYDAPGR